MRWLAARRQERRCKPPSPRQDLVPARPHMHTTHTQHAAQHTAPSTQHTCTQHTCTHAPDTQCRRHPPSPPGILYPPGSTMIGLDLVCVGVCVGCAGRAMVWWTMYARDSEKESESPGFVWEFVWGFMVCVWAATGARGVAEVEVQE
jgi:hypothetical protein